MKISTKTGWLNKYASGTSSAQPTYKSRLQTVTPEKVDATRVAIQNPILENDEKVIAAIMNKYGINRDAAISTINLNKQAAIKAGNTENKIDYNYNDPRSSSYTGNSLIINPNQLKGKGARILEAGNYGPMVAAGAVAATAPLVAPTVAAMNTSLAGVPGLTLNNLMTAGFAGHGLKSVVTGEVAEPWKKASKTGNPWDYADAVSENIMTGLELIPLAGPLLKEGAEAINSTRNWLQGYKPVNVSKQLPGSPNAASSIENRIPPPQTSIRDWLDDNATVINLERGSSKPKSKMYKASEIVMDPNFNIKKVYRGDKEIPKTIRVQGKSGEWIVNRDSDGTYYFNAAMSNPLESGKAMLKINELLPPKPIILEPNSLSLDSYLNTIKIGKRPHWKMEFENYIPLNHSAKNNQTLSNMFGFKPDATTVPFSSLEDANIALKEINAMLKKQGIKYEADIFSNGNHLYGIKIPNFRLTRDYKKGGVIEDNRGQWAHPGKVTKINSNNITMEHVPYPVLGIGADGEQRMMYPEEQHTFNQGPVTEYPMMQAKYGGWLNHYASGGTTTPSSNEWLDLSIGLKNDRNISPIVETPVPARPHLHKMLEYLKSVEGTSNVKNGIYYPYKSSEGGAKTIGYGHKIKKGEDFSKGLTQKEVDALLYQDYLDKYNEASLVYGQEDFHNLPITQQNILTDYQFNVKKGLKAFPTLMATIKEYNLPTTTPERKKQLSAVIATNFTRKDLLDRNDKFYQTYIQPTYNVPLEKIDLTKFSQGVKNDITKKIKQNATLQSMLNLVPLLGNDVRVQDFNLQQQQNGGWLTKYNRGGVTWLNEYQNGGQAQPIFVSDLNDPRLKAYDDSLRLYNKFKNDKTNYLNFINSQGFNPAYVEQWNTNGYVDTDVHPKIGAVAYGMLQNSGGGFNRDAKGVPIDFTTYPTKTGIDRKVLEDSELNKTIRKRYSIYKKPVQPVLLLTPEIKKQQELVKAGLLKPEQVDGIWGPKSQKAWDLYQSKANASPQWKPNANDLRADGTKKGTGFLGVLPRPDGGVSSEISIGVEIDGKETEIPTLVPTLTKEEIDYLLQNPTDKEGLFDTLIGKSIMDKAVNHAKLRMSKGLNPFYQEGEKQPTAQPVKKVQDKPEPFKAKYTHERPIYDGRGHLIAVDNVDYTNHTTMGQHGTPPYTRTFLKPENLKDQITEYPVYTNGHMTGIEYRNNTKKTSIIVPVDEYGNPKKKYGGWLNAYQRGGIVNAEQEYLNSLASPEVNARQEYLNSFKVADLPKDTPNERLAANKNIATQLMNMTAKDEKEETPSIVYINQAPVKEVSIKEIPKEAVDETPVNMNSKQFSIGDIAKIAKKVGFIDDDAAIIAAIAMRESGGNPLVDTKQSGLDPNMDREYSIGLTQTNWKAHKDWLKNIGITNPDQLRDPETNLKAALALYKNQGNFNPWSGYKRIQQSDVDKARKALGIFKHGGWLNTYQDGGNTEDDKKMYTPETVTNWTEPQYIVGKTPDGHYGYNNGNIYYNPDSPIENINNPWWVEHEKYHHYQALNGRASKERREQDLKNQEEEMINKHKILKLVPKKLLDKGIFKGKNHIPGAEDLMYSNPNSLEGEARLYENYIRSGNNSIFPTPEKKKNGGWLNSYK